MDTKTAYMEKCGQASFEVDLTQVTLALSDALDLVGVETLQHGKRVALMALECARHLQFSPEERHRLLLAAVLHDCGVSSTELHRQIIFHFDWEESKGHANGGFELLRTFPPFEGVARIVRHHHDHWETLQAEGVPREAALPANLLFLVDRVDALLQQRLDKEVLLARWDIRIAVEGMAQTLFAPELVEAFLEVSKSESFWLFLEPHHLERYLQKAGGEAAPVPLTFPELRALAQIFARIVDAKSPFTAQHSEGVARLARLLGQLRGMGTSHCDLLELAGLLHDLGKLRVPDEILHKPSPLTEGEFAQMRHHSFETYQILSRMEGLGDLPAWAAYHHEAVSGDGYPFHRRGGEVPEQARIVALADVFQALAQHRPYRRGLSLEEILLTLRRMAAEGKLDPDLVELASQHGPTFMKACTSPLC